jgi:hypothetical protein
MRVEGLPAPLSSFSNAPLAGVANDLEIPCSFRI